MDKVLGIRIAIFSAVKRAHTTHVLGTKVLGISASFFFASSDLLAHVFGINYFALGYGYLIFCSCGFRLSG